MFPVSILLLTVCSFAVLSLFCEQAARHVGPKFGSSLIVPERFQTRVLSSFVLESGLDPCSTSVLAV